MKQMQPARIMGDQMKYLFAFLIVSTAQVLFIIVIVLGALYFGMENLLNRMKKEKISD